MKALKFTCLTLVAVLSVGAGSKSARALELFTNFNNGTELNWRPYGIPDNAPVWYQSGHPCVNMQWRYPARGENCRACVQNSQYSNTDRGGSEQRATRPSMIHATGMDSSGSRSANDEDWMRGASFLPSRAAERAESSNSGDSAEGGPDESTGGLAGERANESAE